MTDEVTSRFFLDGSPEQSLSSMSLHTSAGVPPLTMFMPVAAVGSVSATRYGPPASNFSAPSEVPQSEQESGMSEGGADLDVEESSKSFNSDEGFGSPLRRRRGVC